ncbi:MAG TPA: YggT family protein [Candidatus Hydrogenedentes bacterium]|nr:YggT family protein [Candidatus Hydrogenedentota bacterium]HPG69106.1 YggT family protein [Candidatus Hydrogenedentota bacterium]
MLDVMIRAITSVLTLYMMAILLRWSAPWIEFDVHSQRWRWIPRITDPLFEWLRRVLPPMGPMDFAPLAALFIVWLVRAVSWRILVGVQLGG